MIDGIDERCWGVFTKCKKGGRKKVRYAKKKGKKKESPSQSTVKYSSERKREKSALLPKQRKPSFLSLKNEILILLVSQDIRSALAFFASLISCSNPCFRHLSTMFLVCLLIITMLFPLHFLEPVKFLAVQFIEFAVNVLDRILRAGDDNVLDSVNTAVNDFDNVVEDYECRLFSPS